MNRTAVLIISASLAAGVYAQSPIAALITQGKNSWNTIKNNLDKAAEKMPEGDYNYRPTPEVQTYAERVAHMAAMIGTCSRVKGGEPKQNPAAGKTSKADLVAALKSALAECDEAWATMNETTAMETLTGGRGGPQAKIGALLGNTIHANEVYGTMGVYLRMKGVVPPSSEGARGGR